MLIGMGATEDAAWRRRWRARGALAVAVGATYYEPLFAPYLERPCRRSATPDESSAARITL
jgi:hypothetical protein